MTQGLSQPRADPSSSSSQGQDVLSFGSLMIILTDPNLPTWDYACYAELFHVTISSPRTHYERSTHRDILVETCLARRRHDIPAIVAEFLNALKTNMAAGIRPTLAQAAAAVGYPADFMSPLVLTATGRRFVQWRSIVAIQLGTHRLATTREQIAQIAYALGFEHPAQFDREFRRTLGLSPRQFRAVVRGSAVLSPPHQADLL
jgi:AraC-like DNA-binding protein